MNPRNRTFVIVGAVIALILILAGIAVVATGSDDSDSSNDDTTDVAQTRPVEMVGEALPTYDGAAAVDAAVGLATPVVTGEQFDGSEITIGGSADTASMLVFLAHWCPHCNAEIPELLELEEAGGIPADLAVVGISTAVASDRPNYPPSEWLVEKGWPWPTLADDEQASAFVDFGGATFPFLVIVDADGTVLARQSGESSSEQIEEWIDATLATA
jgi:thiol-disulfide isomerase/thioredoxin